MKSKNDSYWWKLTINISFEVEESILWKLQNIGINRFAFKYSPDDARDRKLLLWLPYFEWTKNERDLLVQSLRLLSKTFDIELSMPVWEKIENEDWSWSWKKHWKPDPVGEKLLILPSWLNIPKEFSERITLRLDPGSAFGTGSHPSTRLCLQALENSPPVNLKIADIGCGSGILSIAALLMGAREVIAVDIDNLSIQATRENARLNDLPSDSLKAVFGSIEVLENVSEKDNFELIICNILAPVIEDMTPKFQKITSSNARLLLSGLLNTQAEQILYLLSQLGWKLVRIMEQESWILLEVIKS